MRLKTVGIFAGLLALASVALAQDVDSGSQNVSPQADQQDLSPHPELSTDDAWVKKMIWIIALGFFVPAAIIGPWVRKRVAVDLPELHGREEENGLTASQHEPGHAGRNDE